MTDMFKGAENAAMNVACAGFPLAADAAQVIQNVCQGGQWKIQSGSGGGKFQYCRAIGKASNGELAIVNWTNGNWHLSMTDFGMPPGR